MNIRNNVSSMVPLARIFSLLAFLVEFCTGKGNMNYDRVTCGSVIKLYNTNHAVRLHSHEVKYGSGSGQQSCTAISDIDDNNSHWAVKGRPDKPCERGQPIKCDQEVRLEHVTTNCNLHSHLFKSPLSDNQEVSCFGVDGEGDTGDVWTVQCDGDVWEREDRVRFKHKDTGAYLAVSGHRFGRPIHGQREVVGYPSLSSGGADWEAKEGVFIKPNSN